MVGKSVGRERKEIERVREYCESWIRAYREREIGRRLSEIMKSIEKERDEGEIG